MNGVIQLPRSDESANLIYDFFKANEYLLPDPLSLHVDLHYYADKLNRLGNNYIYMADNKAVGIVCGYINDFEKRESYLQLLLVSEKYQGCGIGSQLIDRFLSDTENSFKKGDSKCFLNVDIDNIRALVLYERKGFNISKRIHSNPNKLIMEKSL